MIRLLCRVLGHTERPGWDDGHNVPTYVCLRCGATRPARRRLT